MSALEMQQRLEQLKRRIHRVHLYSQGEPTVRCAGPPDSDLPAAPQRPFHAGSVSQDPRRPAHWVGGEFVFTWGQVRVELEGGRVHCHTGKATREEATLLESPVRWRDLASLADALN